MEFKLKQATHKTQGDRLIGYLENSEFFDVSLAIKKAEDSFYAVLFCMDLPDLDRGAGRFEGKLYVYKIWRVELSQEFENEVYRDSVL